MYGSMIESSNISDPFPTQDHQSHDIIMNEERILLQNRRSNDVTIMARRSNGSDMAAEKTPFLSNEPVRLTPAWESCNLPNDQLNLKGVTMETAALEVDPPTDKYNLVYLTLVLHGIGTLTPWNMFINAKNYFVLYKLHSDYTGVNSVYAASFLAYLGIASQLPNLFFNWLNIFIQIKGNLTSRIVLSIMIEVFIFVATVVLAMVDTSAWPGVFFWLTMFSVVVLNAFNGIFQNSVYGVAARLPPSYTGAVVLGSNIAGLLASVASLISVIFASNLKTAAVYYFVTALFILLACFDTYFALPLNRFYRYHELMAAKAAARNVDTGRPPYGKIFCKAFPQLLNVFIVFLVSLSIFPAIHSDVKPSSSDFFVPADLYNLVTCFLTFNVGATLGSSTASMFNWPGPKYLFLFVWARFAFVPFFYLCKYLPEGTVRTLPVFVDNDWVYWGVALLFSWSSGHFSSLAMMYVSTTADQRYAPQAGMFAAAVLITGILIGIFASMLGPYVVALPFWSTVT